VVSPLFVCFPRRKILPLILCSRPLILCSRRKQKKTKFPVAGARAGPPRNDDNEALNVMVAQSLYTTSGVVNTTHACSRTNSANHQITPTTHACGRMNSANHQITPATTGKVEMLLRILRRAQNYEFDPTSTPTKKKQAMRVGKGIATKNPMYTSVIQVQEAFDDIKQLQEIYSMPEQRASYKDTPECK